MHSTALTHLDGVAANVGAEVWGRRYIVVRVRRPRGGCSSGGAQPVLSLRPDEAVQQHLALISHKPSIHIHSLSLVVVVVSANFACMSVFFARTSSYNIEY